MAFNGSGLFTRLHSWVTDAANNVNVSSTRTDDDSNDIAAGLSLCITKDGQQTLTGNIPFSGFIATGLGAGAANGNSVRYEQLLGYAALSLCEFRLTLTTLTPVTSSDVLAATTVFLSPYKGNRIALFDGSSAWTVFNSAEMSIAVPATTSTMYDVFCFNNSGTPTLEALAWTNDTTRATALVLQNGVLVKSGATTRRYIGNFRTTTVSGQTEDSLKKRYVWNYYNRVRRPMSIISGTGSWTYTTNTARQANASAANQLDFIVGVAEDAVDGSVEVVVSNTNTGVLTTVSMGVNSTTTFSGQVSQITTAIANGNLLHRAAVNYIPAIGRTFLAWLEASAATGTTTWTASGTTFLNGIDMLGSVMG